MSPCTVIAFVPARSFQHVLTVDLQRRALDGIRRHLRPPGRLALHLFDPRLDLLIEPGVPVPGLSGTHPDTGLRYTGEVLRTGLGLRFAGNFARTFAISCREVPKPNFFQPELTIVLSFCVRTFCGRMIFSEMRFPLFRIML